MLFLLSLLLSDIQPCFRPLYKANEHIDIGLVSQLTMLQEKLYTPAGIDMIIIHSEIVARESLGKRSATYSNRPALRTNELY